METSPKNLWPQVLERLQVQVGEPTYDTWLKTAYAEHLDDNCLVIRTPNPFVRNWLQKHYQEMIAEAVEGILGYGIRIHITTEVVDSSRVSFTNLSNHQSDETQFNPAPECHDRPESRHSLNTKYIFSRFVVGANSRLAHAASLAVAESPGREFNPLFLCGGVGLGKTHLMQAIGHYRLEIDPNSKVFYVSTEKFTNDLIASIRRDSVQTFREHYRAADVLLVDDIQFIEGKEYTQEEFFHTFNTLHESGKQVVLAADRPPNYIPQLQERLCSRFSMGLVADVQAPDLETRMAILQKKAEYEQVRLPRNVIEYIASTYTSNIRELEGALTRVVAYTSISGLPITVANIAPVLNPVEQVEESSPEVVLQAIAETFKVTLEDLKGSSRRREISLARQVAMYLTRQHTDLSLPKIGELFGGKDHTTVMYACDKIGQL
ncbi:MAG: chromosomal replication initiator protein DnaA, partial [Oscillatoriales cyanobacterium RM1_1_9]|nr:chromosomal replication initiator protein DnaA [Oscillatoriales cyanobacterium RM1_1_9]